MEAERTRTAEAGVFQVWYQPQVALETGALCGAEALVRLADGRGGVIPPAEFIPELERSGRITELDETVLRTVCADLREAERHGVRLGPVSVNLSRLHLGRADAAERLAAIVQESGVPERELVFELTETAAHSDETDELERLLGRLRAMGFAVSLDDYGIGFSTLKLLADMPFDYLKLDRYFVIRSETPRARAILESTVRLAERLGARTVAEGVETDEQLAFVRRAGCFAAQGYYFFRPLPFAGYLRAARAQRRREE